MFLDQKELQRKSEELKRQKINNIKQNIINNNNLEFVLDESKIETNESLKQKVKQYYNTSNEHLIQELDVSCVTSTHALFYNCTEFNLSLDNWDTSNVEDMSYMLYNCYTFNQTLNLNTSNVVNF